MTTSFERYRAFARFPQMLRLAVSNELLQHDIRTRALQLLQSFPDERRLCAVIESRRQDLPRDVAQAIVDAIHWLEDLGRLQSLSADLRQWHRWIVRHFPDRSDLMWLLAPIEGSKPETLFPPIHEWIRPHA